MQVRKQKRRRQLAYVPTYQHTGSYPAPIGKRVVAHALCAPQAVMWGWWHKGRVFLWSGNNVGASGQWLTAHMPYRKRFYTQ